MKTHTSFAAILAMLAAGAPLVSHAQDPIETYKTVASLRQRNNNADALKLVEQVLKVYGNPNSRVAKQFVHLTPFYHWQKGEILTAMGELDKAYEAFNELYTNPTFKDKSLVNRSKELPGWKSEGFAPLVSAALFQMGNIRYQQAVGKDGKSGDTTKFDEAIKLMEEYLKYYESGAATKQEKSWKLDGKVCFMLMQAYLLKPQPDFVKAGQYVEKGRKSKAALPDDLVISGLKTVLSIALEKPEYVEWGEKMISASPGSYHLPVDRMAPHSAQMTNFGFNAAKLWTKALEADNMKQAVDAARTTYSLFGISYGSAETVEALEDQLKNIGGAAGAVPDKNLGVTYTPAISKKLLTQYSDFVTNHTEPEAYILMTMANTASQMGSKRLAKAGYKMLMDLYPDMQQAKKDDSGTSYASLRDINYLQYSQLCRLTGDEELATQYEKMVDPTKVGDGNKHAVILNKMARLVKEKKWEEVVPVADEALRELSDEKGSANYVSANFSKLAALYMLHRHEDTLKVGEELINSGMLQPGALTEKQVNDYDTQAYFFVVDSAKDLSATDPAMLDKALALAEEFMKKHRSVNLADNPMAPNVYYDAIAVLLKRRGHGKAEDDKKDLDKALHYCDVIARNWPEHDLFPLTRLNAANIIIETGEEEEKTKGIPILEECVNAALKQPEGKGKSVASHALFLLASYAPDFPQEDESAADVAVRVAGYFDRFWKEADYEGNNFSLQMAGLQLMRSLSGKENEKASYEFALSNAQKIISREANYAFSKDTHDPELEPALNTYVDSYVKGEKKFHGKDLTLEEKMDHLKNFPGIQKNDKYTNAILHMALLTSMNEAMLTAKRAGDDARALELERDIARSFRQMRDSFKPADLTNFICVQLGNYEVDYARRLPAGSADRQTEVAMALAYFDQVLSKGKDMVREATLGKANALALSENAAQHQEAQGLFSQLASDRDPSIAGPALMGLTDLYLNVKKYKEAVESANRYINMRGAGTQQARLGMLLKLGQAYCESGNVKEGLQTYMNLYVQHRGNITYSAPACKAMMEQYWKRNNPATGDRLKGDFKHSDRWIACDTGQSYVNQLQKSGIVAKMTPAERDLYNEVVVLLSQYSKDRAVQEESREGQKFQSQLKR
ncbi:MAG: hypothetical protein J1E42_07115 [Akkermansiaceae bacterium]|nr:hypothetical protein [Akkermansiaceae bacterium]